jgi:hypothetical protein
MQGAEGLQSVRGAKNQPEKVKLEQTAHPNIAKTPRQNKKLLLQAAFSPSKRRQHTTQPLYY